MQVYRQYSRKKSTDEPHGTENSRNCFNSFYSLFTGLWSEKKRRNLSHMLKNTLSSICLQIQADYVTFLFEKTFVLKECKEHSIVCMSALMITNKIVLVVH